MGRKPSSEIDTPAKRAKLKPRGNPYWTGISGGRGGVSLGYRKSSKPPGTWIAKVAAEGRRLEERVGHADDDGAAPGGMTYRTAVVAALEWGRRQLAVFAEDRATSGRSSAPTVRSAIEAYVKVRTKRSKVNGENAGGRLSRHVLTDGDFAATPLSALTAKSIERWRAGLPLRDVDEEPTRENLAASSVNRLLGDLRAALNAAAERHRTMLPASIASEIRVGTRALSVETTARHQILTDKEIGRLVDAAFEANEDFGWLVLLLAATGARHSQLTAMRCRDVQPAHQRVMVPGAKKGRSARAKAPIAFAVSTSTMKRLRKLVAGRAPDEVLLQTWAYRNAAPFKWERATRRPWGPAWETDKFWAQAKERAEIDSSTVRYAFRHSSIVRQLQRGLPVRLVAALHDTSSEMVEKHYAAHIVDASQELARLAVLDL